MKNNNKHTSSETIYLDQEGYDSHIEAIENLNVNLGRLYEKTNQIAITKDNLEEYKSLISLQNELIEKIRLMKEKTKNIVIIKKEQNEDIIDVNDTVKINVYFSKDDLEEGIYTLVGGESVFNEEIPKISINSPLGRALYKSSIGKSVFYEVKSEKIKVDIIEKVKEKKLVK